MTTRDLRSVPKYHAALALAGLEFRDVLLFNFFSDSPAKNEWRVVLEQVFHPSWSEPVCQDRTVRWLERLTQKI